ncbi:MAG TPA: PepSY domain-containing protein [Gammaproteobacteria bacterium]|nr:PepSY domain-containing protein [Gammaproteobacteria bacterium]
MGSKSAEAVSPEKMTVASDVRADEAMQLKESGQILPLRDVIEQVNRDYPGRIIEVELEEEDGLYIYEMEIVNEEGVVTELDIDASDGKVLKAEEEFEDD